MLYKLCYYMLYMLHAIYHMLCLTTHIALPLEDIVGGMLRAIHASLLTRAYECRMQATHIALLLEDAVHALLLHAIHATSCYTRYYILYMLLHAIYATSCYTCYCMLLHTVLHTHIVLPFEDTVGDVLQIEEYKLNRVQGRRARKHTRCFKH